MMSKPEVEIGTYKKRHRSKAKNRREDTCISYL
jgi:hypothetical protein